MGIISYLKQKVTNKRIRKEWRNLNKHNDTMLINTRSASNIRVGNFTYGSVNSYNENLDYTLKIGNFCSIAPEVVFLLAVDHNLDTISTFPFKVKCLQSIPKEAISKGDIVIDDDVWIGYGAMILSGVHIGQGAVIAAGAVVTKDVDPYTIVGGVPAKPIKKRFSEDLIAELLNVDYSKLTKKMISDHINELYCPLTSIEQLSWMPRKEMK